MTYPIYTAETGLYSIWYKNTALKERLSAREAADWVLYYKLREDSGVCDWPLEVAHIRVKKYDGIDRTSPRKK